MDIMPIWSGIVLPSDTKVAGVMENNLVATMCDMVVTQACSQFPDAGRMSRMGEGAVQAQFSIKMFSTALMSLSCMEVVLAPGWLAVTDPEQKPHW